MDQGCGFQVSGFRFQTPKFQISGFGLCVSIMEFRVPGFGWTISWAVSSEISSWESWKCLAMTACRGGQVCQFNKPGLSS